MIMLEQVIFFFALAGLVGCTVYLILVMVAAFRFQSQLARPITVSPTPDLLPPVTALKPLCGLEPLLQENLETFFQQDYPNFEIIFGAQRADDPALQIVETLRAKHPQIKTSIVVSGEPPYPNAKIYILEKMLTVTSNTYLTITDSDVQVRPTWLKEVISPLLDPSIGLITCLYRGVPPGGLWPQLEGLGMSVEMTSGVLVADLLEGMKFALGPSMATRKDVLDKLGGIGILGQYCADDFLLGSLTHAAGMQVLLSRHVIDHVVVNRSVRKSLLHQVRWMKSARFSRPKGHVGTGLTFAMPFGLIGMAAGLAKGSWALAIALLGWAVLNRMIQSIVVGWGIIHDRHALRLCWLYPLRDLLGFCFWCASFLGSEIVWRNRRYRLIARGEMVYLGPARSDSRLSGSAALKNE